MITKKIKVILILKVVVSTLVLNSISITSFAKQDSQKFLCSLEIGRPDGKTYFQQFNKEVEIKVSKSKLNLALVFYSKEITSIFQKRIAFMGNLTIDTRTKSPNLSIGMYNLIPAEYYEEGRSLDFQIPFEIKPVPNDPTEFYKGHARPIMATSSFTNEAHVSTSEFSNGFYKIDYSCKQITTVKAR